MPAAKDRNEQPEDWLDLPAVERRYCCRKSAIYKGVADGTFPKPYNPVGSTSRWKRAELDAHDAALKPSKFLGVLGRQPASKPPPKARKRIASATVAA